MTDRALPGWYFALAHPQADYMPGEPDRWLRDCGRAKVQLRVIHAADRLPAPYLVKLRHDPAVAWRAPSRKLFGDYATPELAMAAVDNYYAKLEKLMRAVDMRKVML